MKVKARRRASIGWTFGLIVVAVTAIAVLGVARTTAQVSGQQGVGELTSSARVTSLEVLLRIEKQLIQVNERLARVDGTLSGGVSVRVVEPLPAGMRPVPLNKSPTTTDAEGTPDQPPEARPSGR